MQTIVHPGYFKRPVLFPPPSEYEKQQFLPKELLHIVAGCSGGQKYFTSLPSMAERRLLAAEEAPMRNRSVVSLSLPRISSTTA